MGENKKETNMQEEDLDIDGNVTNEQVEQSQCTEDADKLADLEQKYNELNDSYLRLNAEFDNYRKRTLKEKAELLTLGGEKVLVDILPVADDFERALDNISKTDDKEAIVEGIELIYNKFVNFLSKHGVKEIESLDQPFDVDKHEAVTTIPASDPEQKNKIVDCIQKGYTLGDKVIRFPKVIVAK